MFCVGHRLQCKLANITNHKFPAMGPWVFEAVDPPPPPPPKQTDGPVGKAGLELKHYKHLEAVAMLLITPPSLR